MQPTGDLAKCSVYDPITRNTGSYAIEVEVVWSCRDMDTSLSKRIRSGG